MYDVNDELNYDASMLDQEASDLLMSLSYDVMAEVVDGGLVGREELADALIDRAMRIRANTYDPPYWRTRV